LSKGNPLFAFRVTRKEYVALRALAQRENITLAGYGQRMVKEHLEGVITQRRGDNTHLENLVKLTKDRTGNRAFVFSVLRLD
jgi:hypothetical protein